MSIDDEKSRVPRAGHDQQAAINTGVEIGHYRVERLLGRGGMGEVYAVQHGVLQKRYALKLIHRDLLTHREALPRFQREARVMASLQHPGIVRVDEYGDWEGRPWLRMEYMDGMSMASGIAVSLEDRLRLVGGKIAERDLLELLEQVLGALGYAHRRGVIHRDIKPGNLLFGDGRVKLSDFGLVQIAGEARLRLEAEHTLGRVTNLEAAETLLDAAATQSGLTSGRERSVLGTYAYMSPEQRRGEALTPASDLYALGVVTYKALTGESVLGLQLPSRLVSGIHRGWDEYLMCALENRPEQRFASAEAMLRNLPRRRRRLFSPGEARPEIKETGPVKATRAKRYRIRRLWWLPVGLLGALLLFLAMLWVPEWLARLAADRRGPPAVWSEFMIGEERRDSIRVEFDGIVDLEMIWIPPGTFLMGSAAADPLADPVMETPHAVVLTNGFWMGDIEITREIFFKVVGLHLETPGASPFHPMTGLSWEDANYFANLLTGREREAGRLPEGYLYRLPTEAEWEYACRAGTPTRYFFGNDPAELSEYANYNHYAIKVVGLFRPNPFGLYDLPGNAWEWVDDWYAPYPPVGRRPRVNPVGPETGDFKVVRGGAFADSAIELRSASRGVARLEGGDHVGFRVVMAQPLTKSVSDPD